MSVISRYRWRISIRMSLIFSGFIFALVFALSVGNLAFAASNIMISSDPFTNNTSNHKTEVEPSTFAFGNTIVSERKQGRFFDGGGSDIGFATSTNGGVTWARWFPARCHRQLNTAWDHISVPAMPRWPSMPSTTSG